METYKASISSDAELLSALLENDGQRFCTIYGHTLEQVVRIMDATVELWRPLPDGSDIVYIGLAHHQYGITMQDRMRYVFRDGSAIVVIGDAWDIEGDKPATWSE